MYTFLSGLPVRHNVLLWFHRYRYHTCHLPRATRVRTAAALPPRGTTMYDARAPACHTYLLLRAATYERHRNHSGASVCERMPFACTAIDAQGST